MLLCCLEVCEMLNGKDEGGKGSEREGSRLEEWCEVRLVGGRGVAVSGSGMGAGRVRVRGWRRASAPLG